MITLDCPGGVIFSDCQVVGSFRTFLITVKSLALGLAPWLTADSIGMNDSTGKLNVYIENTSFRGLTTGIIDADDNARVVLRNCNLEWCGGFNSHGFDTSPYGMRHGEIYNCNFTAPFNPDNSGCGTFIYPFFAPAATYSSNVGFNIWFRGGTGVIHHNNIEQHGTSCWGNPKFAGRMSIRGVQDMVNNVFGGCGGVTYPVPRGIGQSHDGVNYITDPLYCYSNSGPGWGIGLDGFGNGWGNPCGLPDITVYCQQDRDYILSGGDGTGSTAKPGYTPYTYPHPLAVDTVDTVATAKLLPLRMIL